MEKQNKDIKELVLIPIKLLIICVAIALLVSCVNALTSGIIAENEAQKVKAALSEAFPDAEDFSQIELTDSSDKTVTSAYSALSSDGEAFGYAVMCAPQGFKDAISMMVSFEKDGTIKQVKVISMSETTGIGDRITTDEAFISQFSGKTGELSVGQNVDAISGATVSSKAVTSGVNSASACVNSLISQKDAGLENQEETED